MQALFLLRIEAMRSRVSVTRLTQGVRPIPRPLGTARASSLCTDTVSPALRNSAPPHVTDTDANHHRQYHAQRQGRITDVQ